MNSCNTIRGYSVTGGGILRLLRICEFKEEIKRKSIGNFWKVVDREEEDTCLFCKKYFSV